MLWVEDNTTQTIRCTCHNAADEVMRNSILTAVNSPAVGEYPGYSGNGQMCHLKRFPSKTNEVNS